MPEIEYMETDGRALDLVGPLWYRLKEHHGERSLHFREQFDGMTFEKRKRQLLDKSKEGGLHIAIATDTATGETVGYCVSTIRGDGQGEVESLSIEDDYCRQGIGDALMKKALRWMDTMLVTKKVVAVAVGNEDVFGFYRRYGFHPRAIILEQTGNSSASE